VHLLQHEVRESALLRRLDRPVDVVHQSLARAAINSGHGHRHRVDVGYVPFVEEDHPARVGEHRCHIRREEVLALAQPDDERHVHPGADQPIRLGGVHHGQRVRAVRLPQRDPRGLGDVAGVRLLDEVRERFRVGVRAQLVAALAQTVAQRLEVFDDAVVDDGDLARAIGVRVGVQVVGPAVRRPARMGKADSGRRCAVE
jgi:hypothetical protein